MEILVTYRPEGLNCSYGKCPNWFTFSKRIYVKDIDLYVITIDEIVFYSESEGTDYSSSKNLTLIILSDPHNKKILRERYKICCGCDSDRDSLSLECKITKDKFGTRKLVEKVLKKIKCDGAVVKHECSDDNVVTFILQNYTFYVDSESLNMEDNSNIVKYSKKFNTAIREKNNEFPDYLRIDDLLRVYPPSFVSMNLYSIMKNVSLC